jgi:hypothetical protein
MNLRAMLGEVGASEGGFDFRNQKFCAPWRRGDKIFTRPATPRDLPELEGGPPPVRNALGAYVVLMFAMIRRSLNGELALTQRSIVP